MRAKPSLLIAAAVALLIAIVASVTLGIHLARNGIDSSPRPGTSTPVSGLPTINVHDLPKEAIATLELIDRGGPFPYRQDGSTFRNQENLLPKQATGYYREYTVKTPGEGDRGARRLIVGHSGDVYYTADHYESFRQVLR
jgi:ribonuclease T1